MDVKTKYNPIIVTIQFSTDVELQMSALPTDIGFYHAWLIEKQPKEMRFFIIAD